MSAKGRGQGLFIPVVIAVTVGVACYVVARSDPFATGGSRLGGEFRLNIDKMAHVDPELIKFSQTNEIPVEVDSPSSIVISDKNELFVAGDSSILSFDLTGKPTGSFSIDGAATALSVADEQHEFPRRIYAAVGKRVDVFDEKQSLIDSWEIEGLADEDGKTVTPNITSLATTVSSVFVADAANKVVHQLDTKGKLIRLLGDPKARDGMPRFVVPSPYFDIAVDVDGFIHVVNPGVQQRFVSFSDSGRVQSYWGENQKGAPKIEGFFGCCNPSHIALGEDGSFVTSEKGIPRIKIYDANGDFDCVVASTKDLGLLPAQLSDPRNEDGHVVFDVAIDKDDRVFVLDPSKKRVLVFTRNKETVEAG